MKDQVIPVEEGWALILEGKLYGPYSRKDNAERMFVAHRTRVDMQHDALDPLIRPDRPE